MSDAVVDIRGLDLERFRQWPCRQEACLTCGLCSSVCPVSGVDRFDPRMLVRMIALGMQEQAIDARWPWICTMCGKCEAVCPMQIDIPGLVRAVRGLRDRQRVPGILHKGVSAAMQSGNNLGLPKEDFIFILEDVAEEIAAEPGFEGFKVAVDRHGAKMLTTIHNKLVNTHTEDLKHWWKIFFAAGEDWTVASDAWEGVNWGFFTGDDAAMKVMIDRLAAQIEALAVQNLMWPE